MDNGTWALKSNYSSCEPILEEKVGTEPCVDIDFFFFLPVLYIKDRISVSSSHGCGEEKTNQKRESSAFSMWRN